MDFHGYFFYELTQLKLIAGYVYHKAGWKNRVGRKWGSLLEQAVAV